MAELSVSRVVVVADDDDEAAGVLAGLIERHGLRPARARTRAEVLGLVDRGADAVFLDIKASALDAGPLLAALRQRAQPPPVVICTHDGRKHHVVFAMRQGCVDWLDKPVSEESVTDALRRLARETRRRRTVPPAPPPEPRRRALFESLVGKLRRGALAVPHPPRALDEIRPLLQDPELAAPPVVSLLERDASLARKTFVLANALHADASGFDSPKALVAGVGPRRVATLMLTVALRSMLSFRVPEFRALFGPIGQRHVLAGEVARRLWVAENSPDPDFAFLTAMLHDVGEPFLLRVFAELAARFPEHAPSTDEVTPIIRDWHAPFGARLLIQWDLGDTFAQVARDHHAPQRHADDLERRTWIHVALLADHLACEGTSGGTTDGDDGVSVEACAEAAGISMKSVQALRAQLPALRAATTTLG